MTEFTVRAIGYVRGGRDQPIDDDWDAVTARIELDPLVVFLRNLPVERRTAAWCWV